MAQTRKPAREVAQDRGDGEFWIDHARITSDDEEWLGQAKRLTLWNVTVPEGLLGRLRLLWWLDLRGGNANDLAVARGCMKLRYLQVNQVRGMTDLGLLTSFRRLELLSLYGLTQVVEVPSLRPLKSLARLEVGQMRNLETIGSLLDAPSLRELLVQKHVGITDDDVSRINRHRSLASFEWIAEDVPLKVSMPVRERIGLPPTRSMFAIDWFKAR